MIRTDATTIQFIQENMMADTTKLVLAASKYPNIDIPFVADQILARRQIKDKLPDWYACPEIILPSRIAAEQCSSAPTAIYKQQLLKGNLFCDLTGGLGVDSFYFSQKTTHSYYVERFPEYCEAARHNFDRLGATHIEVINGDCREIAERLPAIDCFYIDPARRGDANKRLFALEDCEPDIISMKDALLQKANRLIVKISPMADISRTLQSLPETTEIHVLSVKNECKELIFVLDQERESSMNPEIHCVNFTTDGTAESYSFELTKEHDSLPEYAHQIESYLYEPNASVLKAGAFKQIATDFGLKKLQVNSHLYTSDQLIDQFPGRIFEVTGVTEFSSKTIKKLSTRIPKANITVRNFPLSVDELRKKSGIKDGGSIYLFATTLAKGQKVIIECVKADSI